MFLDIIIIFLILFLIEIGYFKIANYFNIIDKPNERSSHTLITLRGGGVIFIFSWLLYFIKTGFQFPYFTLGLVFVAIISFLDDILTLSSKIRILIHLISFTLCFYELNIFDLEIWQIVIVYIVSIGCLNAINFMDGINGMTGMYSLAIFIPLLFYFKLPYKDSPILFILMSIIVFGIFNFRKKAKCFAGDVGSVSMAFIIIFFILGLIFNKLEINDNILTISKNRLMSDFDIKYILLLTLYGIDAILTIIQRIYLKENIFSPHRRHLYQLLANELKWSHLLVSFLYFFIQIVISCLILYSNISGTILLVILLAMIFIYIFLKISILKKINTNG